MSNAIIGFFPSVGPWEIVAILAVALLMFGGKKLPELARGLGKGLRQFKEEVHAVKSDVSDAVDSEPDYSETSSVDDSGDAEVAHDSDDSDEVDEEKGPDVGSA
ncbi:MAG: twin-arginine translocase TatA/TatE family subunit [Phycisphaerae bacterium]|jgi:sec-independent protein translocase protein TatA|nr:twin-arginine translocase TatA/TatE family subunit [Phycisphaerae bacterium]